MFGIISACNHKTLGLYYLWFAFIFGLLGSLTSLILRLESLTYIYKYSRIITQVKSHLGSYPCPININFMWNFGFLIGLSFVIQIVTGLLLASRYTADTESAFQCVQHIIREVNSGWLYRSLHCTGASAVFIFMYLHITRGLLGSYIYLPTVWISGFVTYYITIITGFLGYVLPWGQMSFWGATVITNLLSPIPYFVNWLIGGFFVSNSTLKRFYVIHFVLPFITLGVVVLHIFFLHSIGSGNPLGINTAVKVPFFPTMLFSDFKGIYYFLILLIGQTTLGLIELSHPDNAIKVNRFTTPLQIVPEWYFLTLYALLKIIPSKTGGVLILLATQLLVVGFCDTRIKTKALNKRQCFTHRDTGVNFALQYINTSIFLGLIGSAIPQKIFIAFGIKVLKIYIISIVKTVLSGYKYLD